MSDAEPNERHTPRAHDDASAWPQRAVPGRIPYAPPASSAALRAKAAFSVWALRSARVPVPDRLDSARMTVMLCQDGVGLTH